MLRGPILSCSEGEGAQYSMVVLEIGDWNMDTDASVSIAHGCADISRIRNVSAFIKNDAGDEYYQMCGHDGAALTASIDYIDSDYIYLTRAGGLFFDSANFSATSYNRGWVTIFHLCPGS